MVVLEGGGILSSAGNQYLQPDYLSPLPTTLDAKKSPLALLAQTCSQIGSDTPTSKSLLSSLDKSKKSGSETSQRLSPSESKVVFKPYESVVSKRNDDIKATAAEDTNTEPSPEAKSVSPTGSNNETQQLETEKLANSDQKSSRGASPIIRSGLEILQGHSKESKHSALHSSSASSLCCAPGLEHANPAFRPPFPGVPLSHHGSVLGSGYPSTSTPYLSYARVKTPSGGEALVPVCKDPYCSSCQFGMQNQQLLLNSSSGACPSGCTQCDHQKYNLAMAMAFAPPGALSSNLAYSQLGRPFICSWIAGDAYCGKRFMTSEELLQHLRTHTNTSDVSAATTSAATSLLNPLPLFSSTALHRSSYSNPPLSPLSATRYHPYGKTLLTPSLTASPYSAFNPTGLTPYYSPYTTFGQRIGSAAAHP